MMPNEIDALKKRAGESAAESVQSGMIVGLGHGSTAIHAVRRIAERFAAGELKNILGVPCSLHIEAEARRLGIPLTTLEQHPVVDLTIDGADEVSPELDVIKGGGGALLREKIVAQASRQEIIVVDESKLVPALGTHWAVPIEVIPFGWRTEMDFLASIGGRATIRKTGAGTPFKTDQGNLILDGTFGPIENPGELAARLNGRAAIVEHGLFLGLVTEVIVAGEGGIRHLKREKK